MPCTLRQFVERRHVLGGLDEAAQPRDHGRVLVAGAARRLVGLAAQARAEAATPGLGRGRMERHVLGPRARAPRSTAGNTRRSCGPSRRTGRRRAHRAPPRPPSADRSTVAAARISVLLLMFMFGLAWLFRWPHCRSDDRSAHCESCFRIRPLGQPPLEAMRSIQALAQTRSSSNAVASGSVANCPSLSSSLATCALGNRIAA